MDLSNYDYDNLLYLAVAASPNSIYVSDYDCYVVLTYKGLLYKVTMMQEIDDIIADHESMTIRVDRIIDLVLLKDPE
jgi:hypothetical protein